MPNSSTTDDADFVTIDDVISSFVARVRAGESVSVDSFAARCPDYRDDLSEMLPIVLAMEQEKATRLRSDGRLDSEVLRPGQMIDDLRLARPIGEGGMGFVWEAVEPLGRRVAIKILRWKDGLIPSIRQRFLMEAQIAAKLNHRHLLPIYRVGESGGLCYFVMPLVQGVGLNVLIRDARKEKYHTELPLNRSFWSQWMRVAFALAKGLRHAHKHGVLHRDIKPSNVLVEAGPIIRLADFGLALASDEERDQASICGTVRYMSREQLDGEETATSDVYSLALTLAEMIVGKPMFQERTVRKLIKAVRKIDVPPLRALHPETPKPIEAVLYRATRPHAADRTPTAEQFLVDLIQANRKLSNV